MNITIESIEREVERVYNDEHEVIVLPTKYYEIDFIIESDGHIMKSNLRVKGKGDMSFDDAENYILKVLSK